MIEAVSCLLRDVGATAILPRFRRLATSDVRSKSPGEEVTVADEEAERLLTAALIDLLPGSVVIGEEAASRDPSLLSKIADGTVWLVDPLDGTANFVAGDPCFSTMVALLREGRCVASWMASPASGRLHVAELGSGSWIDGSRVRARCARAWSEVRGAVLTRFLPEDVAERVRSGAEGGVEILPGLRCAGEEYPAIAMGAEDFAIFWRALPWDHAPGILFLEEAGGRAAGFDGRPFQPKDHGAGLLAARSPRLWDELAERLLGTRGRLSTARRSPPAAPGAGCPT